VGGVPLGEDGVQKADRGGLEVRPSITVKLLRLKHTLDAEHFVEECMPPSGGILVVGVPGRFQARLTLCTVEAAYIYTAEDITSGSRIKNRAILYLMNLLGLKQARDVVEAVDTVDYIIIIGTEPGKMDEAARYVSRRCGAVSWEPPHCNIEELAEMAVARLERFS
jgi:hypothetical protein